MFTLPLILYRRSDETGLVGEILFIPAVIISSNFDGMMRKNSVQVGRRRGQVWAGTSWLFLEAETDWCKVNYPGTILPTDKKSESIFLSSTSLALHMCAENTRAFLGRLRQPLPLQSSKVLPFLPAFRALSAFS